MKSVEISARTAEEAVEEALHALGLTREQAEIEVLDEGSKGLFGLLGSKQARVRVTEKQLNMDKVAAAAEEFLAGLLERLGVDATVQRGQSEDGAVLLEIVGRNLGLVIGQHGQMLDAVQYLVNVIANKGQGDWVRIVLDAEGYRARRADALKNMAQRVAAQVKAEGKRHVLEPMNAAERRIVHMILADDKEVATYSEGEEPYRRVVIGPAEK